MTRLDSARETAGRTMEALAPHAATAKDTVLRYAEEARRIGRHRYGRHVAPQLALAFSNLPPETQQATLKAVHRAQEAALAARLSAVKATDQARTAVGPFAQEAQVRGAAALSALHGNVTAAEIDELAARNARKKHRSIRTTGLAAAGAIAIGAGVLIWQWWHRQSNPEWLVASPNSNASGAHPTGPATNNGEPMLNGSDPLQSTAATPKPAPKPGPPPPKRDDDDDRPKPHDPRKPQ